MDAILSTGSDVETAGFVEARGGLWDRWQIYDRTNYLTHGGKSVGTNVLFVDGHLECSPFRDMAVRFSAL